MKPAHLGPMYGSQFQDHSVVEAYRTRPPYPSGVFEVLESLQPPGHRRILELGSGTGDATLGLLTIADRVDAVEPSSAMLVTARKRLDDPKVRWIHATSERAHFDGPYSLVVAAESLHWMEWYAALPKVAATLAPGAFLALAERDHSTLPWDGELGELIPKYSTNKEFRPYDLVSELIHRGLFEEVGRRTIGPAP